jgi:hypothetical protein
MRKYLLYMLPAFAVISLFFAFRSATPGIANGVIGDIKYSLLTPHDFDMLNGPGWVLMDGQAIQQNWDLYSQVLRNYSSSDANNPYKEIANNLPDARGVFFRGMNAGRDGDRSDISGNRLVGNYQEDQVGPHSHPLPQQMIRSGGSLKGGVSSAFMDMVNVSTLNNDGKETRPKNIALYVYVKVGN